jgi:hypothetical protein
MAPGKQLTVAQPPRKTPVDISQHSNLVMDLENAEAFAAKYTGLLQQVAETETVAKRMLEFAGAPADERRTAEALLLKCAEQRAQLEEASGRMRRRIEQIKALMAPMETEVERERKLHQLALRCAEFGINMGPVAFLPVSERLEWDGAFPSTPLKVLRISLRRTDRLGPRQAGGMPAFVERSP